MKKILEALTIALVLIFCVIVRAQETAPIDPFAPNDPDAPAVVHPSNPDHLEPIPAYDRDGYDQAIYQSLLGKEDAEVWMIGKPSFSPEYAVILRHIKKFDESSDPIFPTIESEKWVIEYVEAKKPIWRWKYLEGGRMELDIKVTKDLTTKSVEVTPGFAGAIHATWESVLRKTCYPETDYRGKDGATFQFYCDYGLFGEIWTPDTGTPRMLTDLGHKLIEVAKADENDREEHIEQCLKLALELRKRAAKPEQDAAPNP